MKQIVWLDLPLVPADLEHQLIELCGNIEIQPEKLEWMNQFHQHSVPIAAQEYGNNNTTIPVDLVKQLTDFYCKYFSGPVVPIVARTKNMLSQASVTPPHADRKRHVAINYLLVSGGDSVTTSLYTQRRLNPDLSVAENARYNQVTLMSSHVLPRQRWHAFDAQRFHSVENVQTERYLLSLFLVDNPVFDKFCDQYQSIITEMQ